VETRSALLRYQGLRHQRVHRRGSGAAGGRGASRGGRARGAVRRDRRPGDLHGRRRGARCTGGDARPLPAGNATRRRRRRAGDDGARDRREARRGLPAVRLEWVFAGVSLLDQGDEEGARRERQAGIDANPGAWQGPFNLACVEARLGNHDEALAQLERAAELDREQVAKYAPDDEDFASVKDDPRFLALTGQSDADGTGS
jgi:tetratricopeptide (TPR) repeat protein